MILCQNCKHLNKNIKNTEETAMEKQMTIKVEKMEEIQIKIKVEEMDENQITIKVEKVEEKTRRKIIKTPEQIKKEKLERLTRNYSFYIFSVWLIHHLYLPYQMVWLTTGCYWGVICVVMG